MKADLVHVLACLACGGQLELAAADTAPDGHVMAGTLTCAACAAAYPVHRGIPRCLPPAPAKAVADTVDAFGYQWETAATVIEAGRFDGVDVVLDFIQPVRPEAFIGRTVLDGGCGSGRFTLLSAGFGAALTVGVDLSGAVERAFERTRHLPAVLIVQGDVLRLPLRRAFDYAFSIGVLHHTADPRGGFLELASKVVPGGEVSAWVYGRENNGWVVRVISPLRQVTSRLPRRLLLALAYAAALPLTLAIKLVYGPVSRTRRLASLRGTLFYFDYMVFLDQFGYREHALIVFDHAVPAIAEYIPRDAFAEWFRAGGLDQVTISSRAGNSWRGHAVVPAVTAGSTAR